MQAREVITRGRHKLLTSVKLARASEAWLDRPLSEALIAEFEATVIDACGKRGEYHASVSQLLDTPPLRHSIPSLHHSITPSLHHSTTPPLHPCVQSRSGTRTPGRNVITSRRPETWG